MTATPQTNKTPAEAPEAVAAAAETGTETAAETVAETAAASAGDRPRSAARRPPAEGRRDDIEPYYDDGPDTVQRAAATPDEDQPHAELGLRDDEYARIRQILSRRPTQAELA